MTFYNTFANYVGDDSTTDFAIPFSYLSEDDVVVTRQGGAVSYIFLNPSTIRISAPLAVGDSLKIERDTSLSEKAVVFNNGSPFTAGQMNAGFNQLFNAMQESSDTTGSQFGITNDGNWDAISRRITNTDDPVDAQDVATKNYVDTGVGSSVVAAAASAAAASSSASDAASSASTASTAASDALTYSSNASTSASAASNSAANALSSENAASSANTSAQAAQAAAESARDSTLTAYDDFDDRYLGAKASDPTLDNDGAALIAGALYFNTTSESMKVYTGSTWEAAYADSASFVSKSGDTMTGTLNLPSNGLTVGTDQLAVSGGNVGIGTSSPTQALDVNGIVNVGGGKIDIRPSDGSTGTCSFQIGEARTGDGFSLIDLIGDATYTDYGLRIIRTNGGANASSQINHRGTGEFFFITTEAAPIAFQTNSTERMRIDSAGRVGIGTTSPLASLSMSGGGILITGDGDYFSGGAYFDASWKNSVSSQGGWAVRNTSGVFTVYTGVSPGTAGSTLSDFSEKFRIDGSGNVGIGTTSPSYQLQLSSDSAAKPSTNTWTIASDGRLKTETGEYTKGLDAVCGLRPITYTYNGKGGFTDTTTENISIIAQEAQVHFPECVGAVRGEIDGVETDILNWNGHALTFALVNAVKELKSKIETLEARVAQLEGN